MTIERTEDAILVKLPLDTDEKDLKRFLNYFRYRELTKNSKAIQEPDFTHKSGQKL